MENTENFFIFIVILAIVFFAIKFKFKDDEVDENTLGYDNSLDRQLDELAKRKSDEKKEKLTKKKEKKIRDQYIKKNYKIIADFYNKYKFLDYTNKNNRKAIKKQLSDIVNILDKTLNELEQYFYQQNSRANVNYKIILVGIITFKHLKLEKLKKVNKDLYKLYQLGQEAGFGSELMGSLERILQPFGYIEN